MSRSGAIASRELHEKVLTAQTVATLGLSKAAEEAYDAEEAKLIAQAERGLVKLLTEIIGPVTATPYVLKDYADAYAPHQRVCVDVHGYTFNYLFRTNDDSAMITVIGGSCRSCGRFPWSRQIRTLADIGELGSEHVKRAEKTYLCSRCYEIAKMREARK